MTRLDRFAPHTLSLLRVVCAMIFLNYSIQTIIKLPLAGSGLPYTLFWTARWMELSFGSLLLVGLFTRTAAVILAFNCMVLYGYRYLPEAAWPSERGAYMLVVLWAICLHILVTGPGRWSLDTLRTGLDEALRR